MLDNAPVQCKLTCMQDLRQHIIYNVVILVHAINVTDMIIVQSVSGRVEVVVSSSFNVPHTPSEYL